eukprot:CAMPEP_0114164076 /NCGR_PEP_ID=MMETSP0043_2-20121206/30440_1 /TAXON_ID=464988 /ORGANISM="Hemiselmis andersenii, Strain CCMP644" /LENGTH=243 /DNA_ID=CAMNT_0001260643 /DNA_START=49 /DNA_END=780 /DNA_ORIENTATION=+
MEAHAPAACHHEAASQRQAVFAVPAPALGARSAPSTIIAWKPGSGVRFGSDSKQMLRCSQLFEELQAEVKDIQKRKRERDEEERATSKRIALANPLNPPFSALTTVAPAAAAATVKRVPAPLKVEAAPVKVETIASPTFRVPMSPKAKAQRSVPAPLSWPVVHQCLDEVSSSAAVAIKLALDCWRRNTLSDEDLISTIRCHSSASPALAKALSSAPKAEEEFEVASSDDMAALLKLSAGAIPA